MRDVAAPVMQVAGLAPLLDGLARVNAALWRIEDDIRVKEAQGSFDDAFVALARSVYRTNDERAALKRAIERGMLSVELLAGDLRLHPIADEMLQVLGLELCRTGLRNPDLRRERRVHHFHQGIPRLDPSPGLHQIAR